MIIVDDLFSTCEVKPIYSHSDHSASPLSLSLSLYLYLSINLSRLFSPTCGRGKQLDCCRCRDHIVKLEAFSNRFDTQSTRAVLGGRKVGWPGGQRTGVSQVNSVQLEVCCHCTA